MLEHDASGSMPTSRAKAADPFIEGRRLSNWRTLSHHEWDSVLSNPMAPCTRTRDLTLRLVEEAATLEQLRAEVHDAVRSLMRAARVMEHPESTNDQWRRAETLRRDAMRTLASVGRAGRAKAKVR